MEVVNEITPHFQSTLINKQVYFVNIFSKDFKKNYEDLQLVQLSDHLFIFSFDGATHVSKFQQQNVALK